MLKQRWRQLKIKKDSYAKSSFLGLPSVHQGVGDQSPGFVAFVTLIDEPVGEAGRVVVGVEEEKDLGYFLFLLQD